MGLGEFELFGGRFRVWVLGYLWPMMVQKPELEEGETCYYNDDATTDPDVALSYIV